MTEETLDQSALALAAEVSTPQQSRTDNVSQAQIDHWKRQHGAEQVIRIWAPLTDELIEVQDPNQPGSTKQVPEVVAAGYFKKPDFAVLGAVASIGARDNARVARVMFDNCWLCGDERIKNRDQSVASVVRELNKQFKVLESEVEKL